MASTLWMDLSVDQSTSQQSCSVPSVSFISRVECFRNGLSGQARSLAVWILAAMLPNSDLNFAKDFVVDFFLLFFPRKKARKNPPKNPPPNSPRTLLGKIPLGFLQKPFLDLVAPYRAILRYYRCDTPYRAVPSLRAKGRLISDSRFSTPCDIRFFPRDKGKWPFSRVLP